jgi:hypothetical protein
VFGINIRCESLGSVIEPSFEDFIGSIQPPHNIINWHIGKWQIEYRLKKRGRKPEMRKKELGKGKARQEENGSQF